MGENLFPYPIYNVFNKLWRTKISFLQYLYNIINCLLNFSSADDDATNGSEKYLPGYMPDAGTQHMWDTLAARALNPDKPLPRIADDVLSLLEQPEFVRENCESVTEKIKNLFFLEKKKPLRKWAYSLK